MMVAAAVNMTSLHTNPTVKGASFHTNLIVKVTSFHADLTVMVNSFHNSPAIAELPSKYSAGVCT
jgi:hypothetical protein